MRALTFALLAFCFGGAPAAQTANFPFIQTSFSDPAWVMVTSDLLLTDGQCVVGWYDDPERPCYPQQHRYWKLASGKEDGEAIPLGSLGLGQTKSVYVREGFDAYIYPGSSTDTPYPKQDSSGFDHPVILNGPYYFAPVFWKNHPQNPSATNFAQRTYFTSSPNGALQDDSLVIGRRRVIIVDIDGLRRDAFYDLLARTPWIIPNMAGIVLGRSEASGSLLGQIPTAPVFTGPNDMNNRGVVDFQQSFQAIGVDKGFTVLPSYTFACQASIFTGVQPRRHGILGNEWFDRFGEFEGYDDFRRGYSRGGVTALNHVSRVYEWGSVAPGPSAPGSGPCTLVLYNIANSPSAFGYGGLASVDLKQPTIYDALASGGARSLISFNMYTSQRLYHRQPLIDWVRPTDTNACEYIEDPTGLKYDRSMVDQTIAELGRIRSAGRRFPEIMTVYFAGHDHQMHELGNDQKGSLRTVTDPQFGRLVNWMSNWVNPRNILWAFITDHGHTQTVPGNSIVVESDLEYVIEAASSRYDVYDFLWEIDFNVYVALNGGMAQVHVQNSNGNWKSFPQKSDLLRIARACYFRNSAVGGQTIGMVLGKDSMAAQSWSAPYQAYDPVKNDFVDLETYLASKPQYQFVEVARRLQEMNGTRSGDLLLIPNYLSGYYCDRTAMSNHGGMWDTDSLIPMVFAGRPLQRVPDSQRTITEADQYDLGACLGGYLGKSVPGDGVDRLGPLLATRTALVSSFGQGCGGSEGIPFLSASPGSLPWTSENLDLELGPVPVTSPVSLMLGTSRTSWNGLALPASLAALGMPGCTLLVSAEQSVALQPVGKYLSFQLSIPNLPSLAGVNFYTQAFVIDPTANPMGLATSNAVQTTIGVR